MDRCYRDEAQEALKVLPGSCTWIPDYPGDIDRWLPVIVPGPAAVLVSLFRGCTCRIVAGGPILPSLCGASDRNFSSLRRSRDAMCLRKRPAWEIEVSLC